MEDKVQRKHKSLEGVGASDPKRQTLANTATPTKKSSVQRKLDGLAELERSELVALWVKRFKCEPPKGIKRGLLERAAAYQLQSRAGRGLKPQTLKALLAIAEGREPAKVQSSGSTSPSPSISKLNSGSKLMREWHGRNYQVNVTDHGFEWDGKSYTSLSAIACAITGTKWSGPRFFGVAA